MEYKVLADKIQQAIILLLSGEAQSLHAKDSSLNPWYLKAKGFQVADNVKDISLRPWKVIATRKPLQVKVNHVG